ncbi:hypothetical protein MRX96_046790 [Rhipicephalus microplus]
MAGVADMMEVLAKGRIFEVSFDEYINTVNGLFNFLEIYVVFNGTAAMMYILSSIVIVRDSNEVGTGPVMGLLTGGLHAFHCAYSTYKIYYD